MRELMAGLGNRIFKRLPSFSFGRAQKSQRTREEYPTHLSRELESKSNLNDGLEEQDMVDNVARTAQPVERCSISHPTSGHGTGENSKSSSPLIPTEGFRLEDTTKPKCSTTDTEPFDARSPAQVGNEENVAQATTAFKPSEEDISTVVGSVEIVTTEQMLQHINAVLHLRAKLMRRTDDIEVMREERKRIIGISDGIRERLYHNTYDKPYDREEDSADLAECMHVSSGLLREIEALERKVKLNEQSLTTVQEQISEEWQNVLTTHKLLRTPSDLSAGSLHRPSLREKYLDGNSEGDQPGAQEGHREVDQEGSQEWEQEENHEGDQEMDPEEDLRRDGRLTPEAQRSWLAGEDLADFLGQELPLPKRQSVRVGAEGHQQHIEGIRLRSKMRHVRGRIEEAHEVLEDWDRYYQHHVYLFEIGYEGSQAPCDTRTQLDLELLHDQFQATAELVDAEKRLEELKELARSKGIFDRSPDQESDFDTYTDDGYRESREAEMTARVDRDWIESWLQGGNNEKEWTHECDEWYAETLRVGDSVSVVAVGKERKLIDRWRTSCEEIQKETQPVTNCEPS